MLYVNNGMETIKFKFSFTGFTLRIVLEERIKFVNRGIILYFLICLAKVCQPPENSSVKFKNDTMATKAEMVFSSTKGEKTSNKPHYFSRDPC